MGFIVGIIRVRLLGGLEAPPRHGVWSIVPRIFVKYDVQIYRFWCILNQELSPSVSMSMSHARSSETEGFRDGYSTMKPTLEVELTPKASPEVEIYAE